VPHIVERLGVLFGLFEYKLLTLGNAPGDIENWHRFITNNISEHPDDPSKAWIYRRAKSRVDWISKSVRTACRRKAKAQVCEQIMGDDWQEYIRSELKRLGSISKSLPVDRESDEISWLADLNKKIRQQLDWLNDPNRVQVVDCKEIKKKLTYLKWYNMAHAKPMSQERIAKTPKKALNAVYEETIRKVYTLKGGDKYIYDIPMGNVIEYYVKPDKILRLDHYNLFRKRKIKEVPMLFTLVYDADGVYLEIKKDLLDKYMEETTCLPEPGKRFCH